MVSPSPGLVYNSNYMKHFSGFSINALLVWLILAGILILFFINQTKIPKNNPKSELAQCLTSKGLKFYGAFWCPHCAEQKALFGSAKDELPYVECGVIGDARGQTQICTEKEITGYPTWELQNGERISGVQSLERLSKIAGCDYAAPIETQ